MPEQSWRSPRLLRTTSVLASLALLAGLAAAPAASAAPRTWYVAASGSGSGGCAHPDFTTIQPAVSAATAGDTIHVCAGTYTLGATITVTRDLAFVGDGAASTILDGGSAHRILDATDRAISVNRLTLQHGKASATGTVYADGGAIYAASVNVTTSTFTANSATSAGGAIEATYTTVTDTTFSGNTALNGGAISGYSITVANSTFTANSAMGAYWENDQGGAISGLTVTVANSTFSGNSARGKYSGGGAIEASSATVTNSTFSGNTAVAEGGTIDTGNGAGMTLTNNILAAGTGATACYGTKTDGGGNAGTDASCGFTQASSHVVTLVSLKLGYLTFNGGSTYTMSLGAGSVAIDAGIDGACAAAPVSGADQRGVTRPQGLHCDAGAYEAGGATYVSVSPSRILDTRSGTGLSGKFLSGTARTFAVTGVGGVPARAVAVTGNLTVTNQTSDGFVALAPVANNNPRTSTLNFPVGDTRANGVTVPLSGAGTLSATYMGSVGGATTDLIFDVTGYFVPNATGATFVPITPARILDTRSGTGLSGKLFSGTARTFTVTGVGGVPAGAVAVTGNLTVTNQASPGFVALTLVANNNPATSTINFPVADNRANGVTIAVSGGGTLSATYMGAAGPSATTDLLFDVTGYFVPNATGAIYVSMTPSRILDTRDGIGLSGKSTSGVARTFGVRGPSTAVAVTGNLTVTNQTSAGFVALTPDPTNNPTTSTINFPVGDNRANGTTVRLSSADVANDLAATSMGAAGPSATTDLIFDDTGYFVR